VLEFFNVTKQLNNSKLYHVWFFVFLDESCMIDLEGELGIHSTTSCKICSTMVKGHVPHS
jgi:hypothetical protein